MPLLFEGLEAAILPCSLILLIPGAGVALAARQRAAVALIGFGVGALLLSWLRFSDRGGSLGNGLAAVMLAGAVVLLVVPLVRRIRFVAAAGGFIAGAAAATLWQPCVGSEFGQLLTELPQRGLSGLALLAFYMLGLFAPLVVLGAALSLLPSSALRLVRLPMLVAGAGVLVILAMSTAAGLTDDLVGQLVEWSVA